MKTRNLVILALVVVVAAAYIFLYERHQATTEEAEKQAEKVFPGLTADAVVRVELATPKGERTLERTDDGWRLIAPIDCAADTAAVDALLRAVVELDAERRLGADEVDPAAYGLDDPETTVTLKTADGALHELRVGGEAPLGSKRAVATAEPGVILCSGWFVTDLDKELDQWRSRDVVEIYPADVVSVQVDTAEDRIQVAHIEDRWQLIEPVNDLADRDHMRNLISDLNALRVEEFVDDPAADADLGLEPPTLTATFLRSEGRSPIRLSFGATRELEGVAQVAVRVNDTDSYWVKDPVLIRLGKAPVRWRSAILTNFESWDARTLSISSGGASVKLSRVSGAWELADGSPADAMAVQDRLGALAKLEAASFDLVKPASEPVAVVEVGLAGDGDEVSETLAYHLFAPMTAGGRYLVELSNRDTIMSVDSEAIDTVINQLDALRQPPEPVETGADELPEEAE